MKTKTTSLQPSEKALLAYSLLADKKAQDPVILDLRDLTLICDYFVICHGTSPMHIRGLADSLLEGFAKSGLHYLGMEGYRDSEWVLVDYGEVVVHIFSAEQREFYDLERLWGDAPRLPAERGAAEPDLLRQRGRRERPAARRPRS